MQAYLDWYQENKEVYTLIINDEEVALPSDMVYKFRYTPLIVTMRRNNCSIKIDGNKDLIMDLLCDTAVLSKYKLEEVYSIIKFDNQYLNGGFIKKNIVSIQRLLKTRDASYIYVDIFNMVYDESPKDFEELKETYELRFPHYMKLGSKELEKFRRFKIFKNNKWNPKIGQYLCVEFLGTGGNDIILEKEQANAYKNTLYKCMDSPIYKKILKFSKKYGIEIKEKVFFAQFLVKKGFRYDNFNNLLNSFIITPELYAEFMKLYEYNDN